MNATLRLYATGNVHFTDARVTPQISFAHITDLHLPPWPKENWPAKYAHGIGWWDEDSHRPHDVLPRVLDEIQQANVDFVFFGGDNLDVYDGPMADRLVELCQQRNLTAWFSFGNHDHESFEIRYVTHDFVPHVRQQNTDKLLKHWSMPHRYYSFELRQARFIVLDAPYRVVEGGMGGFYDNEQVDWLEDQLRFDGPIVVFYHIPFKTPANEERLLLIWNGTKGWAAEDENSNRVVSAINSCANVLGTFVGHTHTRSEDRLRDKWQFVTAAGHVGAWRYVRICDQDAPKSLRVAGLPSITGPTPTNSES